MKIEEIRIIKLSNYFAEVIPPFKKEGDGFIIPLINKWDEKINTHILAKWIQSHCCNQISIKQALKLLETL